MKGKYYAEFWYYHPTNHRDYWIIRRPDGRALYAYLTQASAIRWVNQLNKEAA